MARTATIRSTVPVPTLAVPALAAGAAGQDEPALFPFPCPPPLP
jgi:hypothetical protein